MARNMFEASHKACLNWATTFAKTWHKSVTPCPHNTALREITKASRKAKGKKAKKQKKSSAFPQLDSCQDSEACHSVHECTCERLRMEHIQAKRQRQPTGRLDRGDLFSCYLLNVALSLAVHICDLRLLRPKRVVISRTTGRLRKTFWSFII